MNYELKKIIKAAESGGQVLKKYFGQSLKLEEKSMAADFRTSADLDSEAAILRILSKEFPNYNIYSEEKGKLDKKSEYTFVIDPLDGSNNFVLGIPNFSVCIALTRGDQILLSVIHNPILNHTYFAQRGRGAFLADKRLQVSKVPGIERATIVYTCSYVGSKEYESNIVKKLTELKIKRLLTNWSPGLDFCLLASGKIEAIINNNNEVYDYMAGKLIAIEAGALVTDFKGGEESSAKNGVFLVSNGTEIHHQLLKIL